MTLWVKIAVCAAALLTLAGACAAGYKIIYDRGQADGVASQQPTISALRAQVAIDATTMQTVNTQAAANLQAATTAKADLQAATDANTAKRLAADSTFSKKLAAATLAAKTPGCATASTNICPALLGY